MPDGLIVLWLELLCPQSFIAERVPVELLPRTERSAADDPLEVVLPDPVVVPLDPDFDAMLPEPQSVLLLPKALGFDEWGLALLAPPVLVCASAAVPSVNATIDATVRISRCIQVSSCLAVLQRRPMTDPAAEDAPGKLRCRKRRSRRTRKWR